MGISISSNSSIGSKAMTQQHNSVVDSLQRQKTELQNRLKEINASKEDSKTKAAKIKEITQQIAEIDSQIQQAKIQEQQEKTQEAMTKSAEKAAEKQQEENKDSGGVVMSASLSQMVYVSGQNSNLKTLSQVRTKLEGEINVANAEMKNSVIGASNAYQLAELSDGAGQFAQVEQKMADAVKNTQRAAKAVQKGIEKADKKFGGTSNSDVEKAQDKETESDKTSAAAQSNLEDKNDSNKQQRTSIDITI